MTENNVRLKGYVFEQETTRIKGTIGALERGGEDAEARGRRVATRKKIREGLNADWNTTDPNLLLNLPTKVSVPKELIPGDQNDPAKYPGVHQ